MKVLEKQLIMLLDIALEVARLPENREFNANFKQTGFSLSKEIIDQQSDELKEIDDE
jgi:hypothetical protein